MDDEWRMQFAYSFFYVGAMFGIFTGLFVLLLAIVERVWFWEDWQFGFFCSWGPVFFLLAWWAYPGQRWPRQGLAEAEQE